MILDASKHFQVDFYALELENWNKTYTWKKKSYDYYIFLQLLIGNTLFTWKMLYVVLNLLIQKYFVSH